MALYSIRHMSATLDSLMQQAVRKPALRLLIQAVIVLVVVDALWQGDRNDETSPRVDSVSNGGSDSTMMLQTSVVTSPTWSIGSYASVEAIAVLMLFPLFASNWGFLDKKKSDTSATKRRNQRREQPEQGHPQRPRHGAARGGPQERGDAPPAEAACARQPGRPAAALPRLSSAHEASGEFWRSEH
ncbi:unnamed protein product [Prorocentrum cordatum]|uniref:Uncharacterized protein n=1 Tax=Prorocentrum cordatum TaxID=2364126 RepID=A0ABN9VJM6_9DINO|nr:unnamed protein product [Polarella glacialis]